MGKNINGNLGWGDLMTLHVNEIRKVFTFKKIFLDKADKIVGNITLSYVSGKRSRKKRKNIFVGIHLRWDRQTNERIEKYKSQKGAEILRWTDRQLDIRTDLQTDSRTYRKKVRWTDGQMDNQKDGQTDGETKRQTEEAIWWRDGDTERWTDRERWTDGQMDR
jgi:hypothetical protein